MTWNKGFTKYTHPGVLKSSVTMKRKHLDNFKDWRDLQKTQGVFPSETDNFVKSTDLAELIGVILGDGNIYKFSRTEKLTIVGSASNIGFIERYAKLTESIFHKKPTITKAKDSKALRICLYQKYISKRLLIPSGARLKLTIMMPRWILLDNKYLVSLLRGLYEAEGSLCIHLKTYTYNFSFSNRNKSLLTLVKASLIRLGYHPEIRKYEIRLRRKTEVSKFRELIQFRVY